MPWLGRTVGYGVVVWLIPFVVSFLIFPLKAKAMDPGRYDLNGQIGLTRADITRLALFESIMPVVLAAVVGVLAVRCLNRVSGKMVSHAVVLGGIWAMISIGIDLPLMLSPPIRMPPGQYFADIGLTYLMIPILTTVIGVAIAGARQMADAQHEAGTAPVRLP